MFIHKGRSTGARTEKTKMNTTKEDCEMQNFKLLCELKPHLLSHARRQWIIIPCTKMAYHGVFVPLKLLIWVFYGLQDLYIWKTADWCKSFISHNSPVFTIGCLTVCIKTSHAFTHTTVRVQLAFVLLFVLANDIFDSILLVFLATPLFGYPSNHCYMIDYMHIHQSVKDRLNPIKQTPLYVKCTHFKILFLYLKQIVKLNVALNYHTL